LTTEPAPVPEACPHANIKINNQLVRTEGVVTIHCTFWCDDCKMIFGVPGLNNGFCTDIPTTTRGRTNLVVPLWPTDGKVNEVADKPDPPKPKIYVGN
jgi:hypothetical protein